jgi:flagellar hook assembly protein FlgD
VEFALGQNYPNPFNPQTTIVYAVPVYDNGLSDSRGVLLEVYNVAGQKIRTLVDEEQRPGEYSITWDGRDDSGMPVGSGVFIYRMRANPFIATRKMIFLK